MKLTIFTPTYNRSKTLKRLYKSLLLQSCTNFEWLIIDDGSTDNTKEVIENFISEQKIHIRYYHQTNGGKHIAYNFALEVAKGEYFFCVDSDDWLNEGTINNLFKTTKTLECNQFIVAYKSDSSNKLLSDNFPEKIQRTSLKKLYFKYKCHGEFSFVFPTALARRFPFPVFEGEKFVTEDIIYDQIDKNATALLLPQVLTICEYQPEGLTSNIISIIKNNPAGFCLYFMQRIDVQPSLKNKIITAGKYNCFKVLAKKQKTKYTGKYKTLVFLTVPLGIIFWCFYKIFRKF